MTTPYGFVCWRDFIRDSANAVRFHNATCATCGQNGSVSGRLTHWFYDINGSAIELHCENLPFGATPYRRHAHVSGVSFCGCTSEAMFPGINCLESFVGQYKAPKIACDCGGDKLGYAPGPLHSFWCHPKDPSKWCPMRKE